MGKPTGPVQPGAVRLLDGDEYRQVGRLLRQKYPVLHGVLVPSAHRLMRSKFGHTVHAELTPGRYDERRAERANSAVAERN